MKTVENENEVVLRKIKQLAETFMKTTNKKFKVNLDYSEESLVIVDDLITVFFKKHRKHFYQAAVLIGSYLGEVIIKNMGGKWLSDHSIKKVGRTKVIVKPIIRAKQRLAKGLSDSLTAYYISLKVNSCFDSTFAEDKNKIEKNKKILIKNGWEEELVKRIFNALELHYVREEAADVLSRIHSKKILDKLLKGLSNHDCAYYAGIALEGFNDGKMYRPLMDALKHTKNNAVKSQILMSLGNLGKKDCVDEIITFLNSDDEILSYYAAIAIGKIGGEKALKYLLSILGGLKPGRRVYAVSALELMADERSVPALIEALFAKEDELREAAARALQFIPDKRAYKPLLYLLKEPSANLRILAAYALANIDKKNSFDEIKKLLNDEVELVRQHAGNILKLIESDAHEMLKCV